MPDGDIERSLTDMDARLEIVRKLNEIVDQHPREAVQVIRAWMRSGNQSKQEADLIEALGGDGAEHGR